MGELPEGYVRCVEAMQLAARNWLAQHPFAELRFTDFEAQMAREAGRPGERVAVVAVLSDTIDRWADNADTRDFLRAIDRATDGEATFMMAKALVDDAISRRLERASGQLPEGDWRCTGCSEVLDGFTSIDGKPKTPGAGSLSVCSTCGALQQVAATGTGYEPLTTAELNKLPKSMRMQLLKLRDGILKERQRHS
jgi:hypothetical protein